MRQRVAPLDSARGLAILGILLLNISAFALPKAAYMNPAYLGDPSVQDALIWSLLALFAQGKFLAIFAILFGAGLQLLLPRGKRWIQTRLSLLLLLGLLHATFFWDGDILLAYSLLGLVCWRMVRDADSVRFLLRTGVILYLIGVLILILLGMVADQQPSRFWLPSPADLQYEAFWKLEGGVIAWQSRLSLLSLNLLALGAQYGWQLAGMMLFGAGLMRSGWLSARFSLSHYRQVAAVLIPLSLLPQLLGIALQWITLWDYRWSVFLLQIPTELGVPLQALGYLALFYGYWPTLVQWRISYWLQQVGRMALSNYLLQTLICTTLFYRLGGYQQFSRLELLGMVPLIWLANVLFSLLWLRYFSQGPLEWLWRKLIELLVGPQRSHQA